MSYRLRSSIVAVIAVALVSAAQAAGVQFIAVPTEGGRQALAGAVWYPCSVLPQEIRLRGLRAPGVKDCPVAGAELPLIVFSHGRNRWYGGHHDTAEALADGGFIVAAINHPDENAVSEGIVDELSAAANRPNDSKRLIDFMLGAWSGSSHIDGNRIGHFGGRGYETMLGQDQGYRFLPAG
jgi:predicted dienelactone hydrolase